MKFLIIPLCGRNMPPQEIVSLQKNFKNRLQIVILCEKNHHILAELSPKCGILVDTFPVGTTEEEMISTTIKTLPPNGVIIARGNCKYLTEQSIKMLLEKADSGADIALFRAKKMGKVKGWFLKVYKKLSKFFFNFTFFEGNISLMYFSARAHLILTETNVSVLTKINRWVQMRIEYIEVDDLPKSSPPKPPVGLIAKFSAYALWTVAMIFLLIFLPSVVKITLTTSMLIFTGALVGAVLLAYSAMQLFCHKHIGKVHAKNVELWERREL
ncbi:MAG: hypothetical protein IJ975_02230 [Clostridia bacterium]|nr:hypothetical protein [Clostridia bacterium]